ncbi:hypothetical protein EJ04DRAFT_469089, partial [Polyplosphaeria fusca]
MLGATTTTTTTNNTNTTTNMQHESGKASGAPFTSTNYSCTACRMRFRDGGEQRVHMKEAWHVENVRRRVDSLAPITRDEFDALGKKSEKRDGGEAAGNTHDVDLSEQEDDDDDDDDDEPHSDTDSASDSPSPYTCLFCPHTFPPTPTGLSSNLLHMHTTHTFSLPSPSQILDLASFLNYLATEVCAWHECLYCGATKDSTPRIQSHMRDKGHCQLNLDREPELLEFWEGGLEGYGDEEGEGEGEGEEGGTTSLSATEMRFASGRVVGSRGTKKASRRRRLSPSPSKMPTGVEEGVGDVEADASALMAWPAPAAERQLARREEMGIIGVSAQQRRALVLAEKKAQRSEDVARRAREWVYAKGANSQKFDQLDNRGKWGKQQHKLLPR